MRWRAAIILSCALAATAPLAFALEASEPAIKAAFLLRFGFYVEWPQAAFAASDSPINLCIVGDDPFGALLDEIVKDKKIGPRAVAVRRLDTISRNSGCHIVYIHDEASSRSDQILAALRGSAALTVTEAPATGTVGIINFVMKDNRVRFDIDDDAAASGGLVISSSLLNLALDVKPRR